MNFQLLVEAMDPNSKKLTFADKKEIERIFIHQYSEGFGHKNADLLTLNVAVDANFVNQSGRFYWGKKANRDRHRVVFDPARGKHRLATKQKHTNTLLHWSAYGSEKADVVIIMTAWKFEIELEEEVKAYDYKRPSQGIFTHVFARIAEKEMDDVRKDSIHKDKSRTWEIISMQNTPTPPDQENED